MDTLKSLFKQYSNTEAQLCSQVAASGSNRLYYRLSSSKCSAIGVTGSDCDENKAFIALSRHFRAEGLNVPEIYAVSEDGMSYLQSDLGDTSLYDVLSEGRHSGVYSERESELLCRTISRLPEFQFKGGKGLDFSLCYPLQDFDARSVMFDLNYFKYCFLKPSGLEFNEAKLQDDFEHLCHDLLCDEGDTFLYRDFQARNVMLVQDEPYFIDYQGGRRGPVYYDLASFVWQARAQYPEALKNKMIQAYIQALSKYRPEIDVEVFNKNLRLFVLFRTLQVLGAYGFRGNFEKKTHFVESIPFALGNLRDIMKRPFAEYPYLNDILSELVRLPKYSDSNAAVTTEREEGALVVKVYSFSYKKGIPEDESGSGGGYVFDCRSLDNPGRHERFRLSTGMDYEVVKYLEDEGGAKDFLAHAYAMVDGHVRCFLSRHFTSLQLCFGCTGGQHRSVYCAEQMARHLSDRFGLKVRLIHREQGVYKEL